MFLIRMTQPKHDIHVAPLGLGVLALPIFYKHVAPLVLKNNLMSHIIRNMFSMWMTITKHDAHVAPLGLGGVGIRHNPL